MRFYCISDNVDTKVGMRLAGVDGVIVSNETELKETLASLCAQPDVGVILISDKLTKLCPDEIADFKLNRKQPLLLAIPDRHGNSGLGETITGYLRDSIGLKL